MHVKVLQWEDTHPKGAFANLEASNDKIQKWPQASSPQFPPHFHVKVKSKSLTEFSGTPDICEQADTRTILPSVLWA